jgi:hypothetical protein
MKTAYDTTTFFPPTLSLIKSRQNGTAGATTGTEKSCFRKLQQFQITDGP